MSLKLKLSLLSAILVAIIVAGFAAAAYWSEERALLRSARDKNVAAVESLAEVCRDALIGGQVLGLSNYLRNLRGSPDTVEAWCADGAGELLGHTDVAKTHTRLDADAAARAKGTEAPVLEDRGPAVEGRAPVLIAGRRSGTAVIAFSRDAMRRRFEQDLSAARRRLAPLAAAALAAGFAGAFAFTALALRPLETLVEGVRAVGKGQWGHQIPVGSPDEVGWLAREFNQMAGKLQELDRMKQDFVSGVTHDLKSPLATVKVAVDLVQDEAAKIESGTADARAVAGNLFTIRRSMERLTQMITSLLEVAHIEQGLTLDRAPVALDDVADRVVKSFALIARQKGLALDLVVETALPPVPADAAKLERALANLVSNALKYTASGGVRVSVSDGAGRQEVKVADTGPGIPPEAMNRLFSKFFRVDRPGEKAEGTGLGLAVVKGIAEAHGGGVSVENAPGGGSLFTLWVPK